MSLYREPHKVNVAELRKLDWPASQIKEAVELERDGMLIPDWAETYGIRKYREDTMFDLVFERLEKPIKRSVIGWSRVAMALMFGLIFIAMPMFWVISLLAKWRERHERD